MAKTNVTNFGPVRVKSLSSEEPLQLNAETAFDEVRVAEFTPLLELDSSNGLSDLRDVQTTANGGTIAAVSGQYRLRTGSTANGSAQLDTAERGRYQPGIEGLPGIGVHRPTAPTGNQSWQAGYFDGNDGFFFGEDATGVYVRLRVGGSDKDKVYQKDWNADTLLANDGDKKNPSGLTLDLSKPVILRMPFVWYFGGPIKMSVLLTDPDDGNRPKLVEVHRFGGTAGEPIMEQPKLPVRAVVDNGGDTSSLDLFVGGRQFAVLGRYAPNRRETAEYRFGVSTSTTVIPLVTFKKKSGDTAKSVKVSGLSVLTDTDSMFEIILGATLTDASFGSIDGIADSETSLEADTSATAISGGQVIDRGLAAGGATGNRSNLSGIRRLGLDIPDDTEVTLAIRTISGTGTASCVFTLEEEWAVLVPFLAGTLAAVLGLLGNLPAGVA